MLHFLKYKNVRLYNVFNVIFDQLNASLLKYSWHWTQTFEPRSKIWHLDSFLELFPLAKMHITNCTYTSMQYLRKRGGRSQIDIILCRKLSNQWTCRKHMVKINECALLLLSVQSKCFNLIVWVLTWVHLSRQHMHRHFVSSGSINGQQVLERTDMMIKPYGKMRNLIFRRSKDTLLVFARAELYWKSI